MSNNSILIKFTLKCHPFFDLLINLFFKKCFSLFFFQLSDIQPSKSIQQTKVDSSLILTSRTANTLDNSPKSTTDTILGLSSTITAATCTNNVNDLWSVARLSLDRTDSTNNETFYHNRNDMSKHFQNFCHSDSSHTHGLV